VPFSYKMPDFAKDQSVIFDTSNCRHLGSIPDCRLLGFQTVKADSFLGAIEMTANAPKADVPTLTANDRKPPLRSPCPSHFPTKIDIYFHMLMCASSSRTYRGSWPV
jgi:hypothetical protein